MSEDLQKVYLIYSEKGYLVIHRFFGNLVESFVYKMCINGFSVFCVRASVRKFVVASCTYFAYALESLQNSHLHWNLQLLLRTQLSPKF